MDNIIIPESAKRITDTCAACNKKFKRTSEWCYKAKKSFDKNIYFCSYKCFRIYQLERQKAFEEKYRDDFLGKNN